MHAKLFKPFLWLAAIILIVSLACQVGGSTSTQEPEKTKEPERPQETQALEPTPETPATEEAAGGPISDLQDVKNAVIQIEAQGTFFNPDFTVSYNTAGLGSGFIIDPSGLAVTNNHVVTGAALLKVWIGGDTTKSYNAKVVAVSECSDLALIDLSGDGYQYLDWLDGSISEGMDVYAAGYPLGEPQFSLTRGIVSKVQAGGETSWASLNHVIEHDALLNPGNSGGPLLDKDGQVVGINYRGRETGQHFAIGRDLALDVIEELKSGKDVEALGVNGEAFVGEGFSGIWVYSVKAGSPADKAGLTGGDIITTLENLVLSTDGTMSDYCDILRSHSPGDTLNIEVLRYPTGQILTGQINGRALEEAASFATNVDPGIVEDPGTGTYSSYNMVSDDTGAIQMEIPVEWTDYNGTNWLDGEEVIGAAISGSADLDAYFNTWDESGVFFGASDDLARLGGYVQLLDIRRDAFIDDCKLQGRYDYGEGDYFDPFYRGKFDLFTNCGNSGNAYLILSATPKDQSLAFLILVELQITKDADFDALDRILATFDVVGVLP